MTHGEEEGEGLQNGGYVILEWNGGWESCCGSQGLV